MNLLRQGQLDENALGQLFDQLMKHLGIKHIPIRHSILTLSQSQAKRQRTLDETTTAKSSTFDKLSQVFKVRKKMSKMLVQRSMPAIIRLRRQMYQGEAARMSISIDFNQTLGKLRLGLFFERPSIRNRFTLILLQMNREQLNQLLLTSLLNPDGSLRAEAVHLLEGDPRLRNLLANALGRQFQEVRNSVTSC